MKKERSSSKKVVKSKYSAPLIFDIGGPDLNVVGATVTMCLTGDGGGTRCACGEANVVTKCLAGGIVATVCSIGIGVLGSSYCDSGGDATGGCCSGSGSPSSCVTGTGFGGTICGGGSFVKIEDV